MRILLFGTGKIYNKYKMLFPEGSIKACLDNDTKKIGTLIDGVPVLSPENGIEIPYDYIYILTTFEVEIRKQLENLGVNKDAICNWREISRLDVHGSFIRYETHIKNKKNNIGNNVLLISHGMDFSGASMALFVMGKVLVRSGYCVTVAGSCDNEKIRNWILSNGMNVIVTIDLEIGDLNYLSWTQNFDLIVVNTVTLYYLMRKRNNTIPVLWWLHDAEEYYKGILSSDLKKIEDNSENIKILAVSEIARNYFLKRVKKLLVEKLPYGMEDFYKKRFSSRHKCIFAIIGEVISRKGTDIFLDAVEILEKNFFDAVEYWIIGNELSDFAQRIKERAKGMDRVQVWGKVSHGKLESLYSEITAVVIPSRDDILPIVSVEAMMNCIGCIISENNDIAKYVKDYKAGFVCSSLNPQDWANLMEWVVLHRDEWCAMGKNGRQVYEKYFSIEIFQKNVISLMESMLQGGSS